MAEQVECIDIEDGDEVVKVQSKNKSKKKKKGKKKGTEQEIIKLDEMEKESNATVEDLTELGVLDTRGIIRDDEDSRNFDFDAYPPKDYSDLMSDLWSETPIYYKSKFKTVREYDPKPKKESDAPKNNCFNCNGDHMMNDCPEPRNHQAITKNRREHMNKYGGLKHTTRYHLAKEQIYAHLKPGQISKELRKALNISDDQLPRHVYMMRNIGYPPAWLEELKIFESGLAIFDTDDDNMTGGDGDSTIMYDTSKVIEYPGYNVMPAPGTLDESRHYRCPPLLDHQSKEVMINSLESHNEAAAKKKKELSLKAQVSVCNDDIMIVVDTEGEPDEIPSIAEIVKSGEGSPTLNDTSSDSPTLEDLETQKKLLMDELESSCKAFNAEPYSTPEQLANVGKVKHIDQGTPILKSASPYSRLPAPDNFSQGICDVINFENLPNATGHYSRMNKLIHKIRKSLNNEIENSDNNVSKTESDAANTVADNTADDTSNDSGDQSDD